MAKKRGGFSKFLGAITGSPYERLLKQIDKVIADSGGDRALGRNLKKLVKVIGQQYEEGNIDEAENFLNSVMIVTLFMMKERCRIRPS